MAASEESSTKNIQVFCRFRPNTDTELEFSIDPLYSISPDNKSLSIISHFNYNDPLTFTFDYIFDTEATQFDVHQKAGLPIIEAVMEGFNGTILAYGQTSSGKTYTMTGPDINDFYDLGLIPTMVNTVFEEIENADTFIEYSIKVSYCEIYLEKIRDLLDINKQNLKIHENKTKGVYISELT